MKVGLDTSVILRLLTGEPRDLAATAWKSLHELQTAGGTAVVSDIVVSEAYFALQHHYAVPKSLAIEKLGLLLTSGDVVGNGAAPSVLTHPRLASANPGFVDRIIHSAYLRDADLVFTFEYAARKLPRTRVLGR